VDPQPSYGVQRRLADISLLESNMQRIQTERNLYEAVYDLIISHDNTMRIVYAAERTILVLERRLEFSRREVEQGEKKRIDYLQELITMAQTKIALLENQTMAAFYERSLEILAGLPFGDLRNVCEQ
jgi:outer membrane protein TolC